MKIWKCQNIEINNRRINKCYVNVSFCVPTILVYCIGT